MTRFLFCSVLVTSSLFRANLLGMTLKRALATQEKKDFLRPMETLPDQVMVLPCMNGQQQIPGFLIRATGWIFPQGGTDCLYCETRADVQRWMKRWRFHLDTEQTQLQQDGILGMYVRG